MRCPECGSENQRKFASEVAVHVEEKPGERTPPVLVFPQLMICLDCGFLQGQIERNDLPLLAPRAAA